MTGMIDSEPALQGLDGNTRRNEYQWWQTGVIYQVYPRSFLDTNGDGVGDLQGIIRKLDYIRSLNVDAVWLSPIYPSPMADFGYDVSDYTDVHPMFGTLHDFDRLVEEAHSRGLKVILDFVPNHTSDRHPWFEQARTSRDNPYHDWYVWHDGKASSSGQSEIPAPPNNWLSMFGGSAWEWDPTVRRYYLHTFLKEQPDVNWRNPELSEAMLNVLRFWLARGVDGFRVDVIYAVVKDELFRDEAPNPDYVQGDNPYNSLLHIYSLNHPQVHDVLRRMRKLLDEYPDRMMVGETWHMSEDFAVYYGKDLDECHLPFNFKLLTLPWSAANLREAVDAYEASLPPGAWPNWVLGNHDQPRIASRLGLEQSRTAQMMLLTLRGTPTCYYGDEIGMTDVSIPEDEQQDPFGLRVPGRGLGRDPERTPMQWDASQSGGFTTGNPWLPLGANYDEVNVEQEQKDPTSMFNFFRALTSLRQETQALDRGSYKSIEAGNSEVFAYVREYRGDRVLVALNFSEEACVLDLGTQGQTCHVLLSTRMDRNGPETLHKVPIGPNEGIIARL